MLFFNRPPIREVFPNYEVTKPQTGTSLDLGSFNYCYVAILYAPPHILSFAAQSLPGGATHSCPSSHTISILPFFPCTVSSAHLSVPCLRPSMTKIYRLPCRSLHRVICSSERCPYPSIFSVPPSPLANGRRTLLLPIPDLTTTSGFLSPRPSRRKNNFYSSPQLCPWYRLPPPEITAPTLSVVTHLLFKNFVYRPQRHPLHYRGLPTVDIIPQSIHPCFPEITQRPLLLPYSIPLSPCCLTHHFPEEFQIIIVREDFQNE